MSDATDRFPKRSRNPWPWLTAIVVLIGIGGAALVIFSSGSPRSTPEPAPPLAAFEAVRGREDMVVLRSEGFVRALEEIDLVSEVEGRVVAIGDGFESGARFAAGAMLVEIEPDLYAARLRQAEADQASARSALDRAENQVNRLSALEAENLGSEARLEQTQVERDAAAASVEQAGAAVERARIRLSDTTIRAPFDARIVTESVALGRYVRPGEPLARLAATDAAEIEIGLAPAQAALFTSAVDDPVGLKARVTTRGIDMRGRVDRIQPRVDPNARTLDVVVRVDAAFNEKAGAGALRLDELVAVEVQLPADEDWWRVPTTALKSPGRLWRLTDEDTLQAVDVEVLLAAEEYALVRGPLAIDDRVLITDLTAPAPGLRVRPLKAGEGGEEAIDGGMR